jgi:signal transduction histidine kinase/CheY-like chemotaxis protein
MRSFRDVPLRRKLVVILMVTSGSALLLASLGVLGWDLVRLRREMARDLAVQAAIVAENTAAPLLFDDPVAAGETLGTLRSAPRVQHAAVYDLEGRIFAQYQREPGMPDVPVTPPPEGVRFTADSLELVRAIGTADRRAGTLYLRAGLRDLYGRLAAQGTAIGLVLAIASLAAFLLSTWLQRLITNPVLRLADTARAISADRDYSRRAQPAGHDEVGVLVAAFNQMLADIQQRDEQLQEANRLKDEFLATLSHELRTPLNAVLGWTRMLREERLPADVRERALDSIERNARAQSRLIEDLLEISRSVSGKLRLDIGPMDLAAVVEAAVDVVRPSADARDIRIETFIERRTPTLGDAERLQQVVWNLLSNAVKFSDPGSRITVRVAGSETVDEIVVSDTGAGISPEFLPYVFDPFRQADGSTTRMHGGLGLGLAIARRIVELHGGRVAAHSDGPGRGAAFSVRLPRRERGAAVASAAAGGAGSPVRRPRLAGLQVLLVEDDPDARELAALTLRAQGAMVRAVDSAAAARAAIEREVPDVIVSDIGMSGQDGYDLIRHVRLLAPEHGGRVPAVALTAYAAPVDQSRALASGFQEYVAKPYEPESLVNAVAAAARSSHPEWLDRGRRRKGGVVG